MLADAALDLEVTFFRVKVVAFQLLRGFLQNFRDVVVFRAVIQVSNARCPQLLRFDNAEETARIRIVILLVLPSRANFG